MVGTLSQSDYRIEACSKGQGHLKVKVKVVECSDHIKVKLKNQFSVYFPCTCDLHVMRMVCLELEDILV